MEAVLSGIRLRRRTIDLAFGRGDRQRSPRSSSRRLLRSGFPYRWILVLLCSIAPLAATRAADPTLQVYGPDQGLGSLTNLCLLQAPTGYVLTCSDYGVFQYDGRRFSNLGQRQGLWAGGIVRGIILTGDGRLAVYYANAVFVSDGKTDATHSWTDVHFKGVLHHDAVFDNDVPHRLVAWRNGLVVLTRRGPQMIVVPPSGAAHVTRMPYDEREARLLDSARAVFSVRGQLWMGLHDGRLCAAEPGAVRCYGVADGLPYGSWTAVIAMPDGELLARSFKHVAAFDPASARWSFLELPDQQAGRYSNYSNYLGLFRLPDGRIATQSDHGLLVREPYGWHLLSAADGVPQTVIADAITDQNGQLWLSTFGQGVMRWIGYGNWQTVLRPDQASGGSPWQTARPPGGQVWVATDTGLKEIDPVDGRLTIGGDIPGSSWTIAIGPYGRLWASNGTAGLRIVDPASGATQLIDTPPVNVILSVGADTVWIGTDNGLFRVAVAQGVAGIPVSVAVPGHQIQAIEADGDGGIFYLVDSRLRHRHVDGADIPVSGYGADDAFRPVVMTRDHAGDLWIGGDGGLRRIRIDADRLVDDVMVDPSEIRTDNVVSLMTDHRGWVWVSTAHGVSVFNGRDWVSLDNTVGLASNDVNQGGLREDPDGSVWIATSQGLSHLLDPTQVFADPDVRVVIARAEVGDRRVSARLPYSEQPLELRFGTTSYARERSIVFRYRLSGVDADWATTASGAVRYPYLPPGRHRLEVVGYDELSRRSSAPVMLDIGMAYPWWRQWWFDLAAGLAVIGLLHALIRLRLRLADARQVELRRLVDAATAEMRAAQAQLLHQARHDALTGLLTRSEIERRLAARLDEADGDREVAIALMDVDHFKAINDGHGHLGGDDVLRSIGMMVAGVVRDGDEAGRYGGEEILLVLDDGDGLGAERILTLHRLIRGTSFTAAGQALRVTCSVGVAWARRGDDWETLIGRADEALYDAKRAGRDRVVEARQPDGTADPLGGEDVARSDRRRSRP